MIMEKRELEYLGRCILNLRKETLNQAEKDTCDAFSAMVASRCAKGGL